MISRRRFLYLAGAGVTTMGLLTPGANQRYSPINPSPTPIKNPELPTSTESWPELDRWELPGDPNCIIDIGTGRCLVGGENEQESSTTGYIAHLGTQAETRIHRFDDESTQIEAIADLTIAGDSVVALGINGNSAHRLFRLAQDGTIKSTTKIRHRETPLWSPRLFPGVDGNGFRLAGTLADSATWAEGMTVVQLTANGTPEYSQTYGHGINPFLIRSNGEMLAANIPYSGTASELLAVDKEGLRYHRKIPDYEIFDIRWIGEDNHDILAVGKTNDQAVEQGFVTRLDESGQPRWWRSLSLTDQSTTFMSIISSEESYRIQSIAEVASEDSDQNVEMVIDSDGEVQGFNPYPTSVFGEQFGQGSVFVTESGDSPHLRQYRDMNIGDSGDPQ